MKIIYLPWKKFFGLPINNNFDNFTAGVLVGPAEKFKGRKPAKLFGKRSAKIQFRAGQTKIINKTKNNYQI